MKIAILEATKQQLPIIQNMARFYAYDLSKSCGFYPLYDWSFPENGLYEAVDMRKYWQPNCYPFLVRVDNELAGFALINKLGSEPSIDWNMGEFFIVGKFQGKGIGRQVAVELFSQFSGIWEITQMMPNTPAILFWRKVISEYTKNQFTEAKILFQQRENDERIVLRFKADHKS